MESKDKGSSWLQEKWKVVEDGFEEPANTVNWSNNQLKEALVKYKAALYILYQAVDKFGFEKIASVKSSKEAWDILEKVYKGDDRVKQVRLQMLKGELESMREKETEGVAEYITWLKPLQTNLLETERLCLLAKLWRRFLGH